MRLSEDRIRRIVQEEAQRVLREGAGGMSILPAACDPRSRRFGLSIVPTWSGGLR
jgi:hypothetical protein